MSMYNTGTLCCMLYSIMYTVCMSHYFMNITTFQVVLMANIPSLSCPAALKSGFKVYLVDNPGHGELNQLATRMAELAVATSTAYIYTMDCESIELKEHAEVLKVLLEADSGECLFVSNNSTPHYPVMIHVPFYNKIIIIIGNYYVGLGHFQRLFMWSLP